MIAGASTGRLVAWLTRCCRPSRWSSSGRRSTRSCSASTTTTPTRRATGGSGPPPPWTGATSGRTSPASTAGGCTTAGPCPGFPRHPHRGFETVTYVRKGLIDHSDSLGAAARFGRGDTQWLTAGGASSTPRCSRCSTRTPPNPLELFQIWVNLPAEDKLAEPHFAMLWDGDMPRVVHTDADGTSPRSP